jgi:hypothetical protein
MGDKCKHRRLPEVGAQAISAARASVTEGKAGANRKSGCGFDRRRSGIRAGILSGTAVAATLWLLSGPLGFDYEIVRVSDGTAESEAVAFMLDGKPVAWRHAFQPAIDTGPTIVSLSVPVRRVSPWPVRLDYGPGGADTWRSIALARGRYRFGCLAVAHVERGTVTFQVANDPHATPCLPAPARPDSD